MTDKPQNIDQSQDYERFLYLVMNHQKNIYGFILSMVPDINIADDLLQETIMVMWRKFSEFQPDTNFKAWAFQIAKYKALGYKKKSTNPLIQFSSEALENIISKSAYFENDDEILGLLNNCIKKLHADDRKLIQMRYFDQMKIKQIALFLQRPLHAMYKRIGRIHHLLQQCIVKAKEG